MTSKTSLGVMVLLTNTAHKNIGFILMNLYEKEEVNYQIDMFLLARVHYELISGQN